MPYSTFTSVYPSLIYAGTTLPPLLLEIASLSVSGKGELGLLNNVLISDTIQHNCIPIYIHYNYLTLVLMLYSSCRTSFLCHLGRCSSSVVRNRMWMILICSIDVWLTHMIVLSVRLCATSLLRGWCSIEIF